LFAERDRQQQAKATERVQKSTADIDQGEVALSSAEEVVLNDFRKQTINDRHKKRQPKLPFLFVTQSLILSF
jgi:hypothetical protein